MEASRRRIESARTTIQERTGPRAVPDPPTPEPLGLPTRLLVADGEEVIGLIRRTVGSMFSTPTADAMRIQYGGSVKPGNIRELMAHPEIDGALVGGASLDPEEFALIVKYQ